MRCGSQTMCSCVECTFLSLLSLGVPYISKDKKKKHNNLIMYDEVNFYFLGDITFAVRVPDGSRTKQLT